MKITVRGVINKIEISNLKISLIYCIVIPPNSTSKNTPAVAEPGANIHPEKQATKILDPVIISNDMTARLPDGSTMDSSHIATLQQPGLIREARQIHILP